MVFLALKLLPGPSLVLFALLTSVSAKIDKADELQICEQDSDIFSMMQSDKSWQNFAEIKAHLGTSASADSNHVQLSPNTSVNVASQPTKEYGQSLVQRVVKYTSNVYQSTMVRSQVFLVGSLIIVAIMMVFCSSVAWRRWFPEQPTTMFSQMRGEGSKGAQSPFLGNSSSSIDASYISPSTLKYNRKPLRSTSPRPGEKFAEVPKPKPSSPRAASKESTLSMPPPVVASIVPKSAETRLGSHHATSIARGSPQPRQPAPTQQGGPASLAPSFVNPAEETRIGVHYLSLGDANEDTAVDVIYPTGQPFLRMTILGDDQHGWTLNIHTADTNQRACSIVSPPTSDARTPYLILNAQGVEHGFFRCVGAHLYEAILRGVSVYMIQGNADNLQYQVVEKSRTVALARMNKTDFPGGEHLEFRVLPGSDAVLIVGILLGITVFNESD